MRDLVKQLLGEKISRRGFVTGMLAAGYSSTAALSALQSVEPFTGGVSPAATRTVTGTGAELMADQIIETGAEYVFVSNGSGLGPLCDAMVDRPQLRLIQSTQEGQVVATAAGYAMASGKPGFCMYSRVGLPHSTSNMYNAMKDRVPLVVLADHASANSEGTDSHEDIDDWMEAIKQYTKWRWVAHQPGRIPEWIRHAYKIATLKPGGPTSIRFPREILYQDNVTADVFPSKAFNIPMELRPNPQEVEAWFEAPLGLLLDPASWTTNEVFWRGAMRRYLELEWQGFRIWGVTAAIIANLSRRITLEALRDAA